MKLTVKWPVLFVSHLLFFGVAYFCALGAKTQSGESSPTVVAKKSRSQAASSTRTRSQALMERIVREELPKKTDSKWGHYWKKVAKSLPPAEDYQREIRDCFRNLPDGIGSMASKEFWVYINEIGFAEVPESTLDALVLFRAHLYRYMLVEPKGCLAFFEQELASGEGASHFLVAGVFLVSALELLNTGGDVSWVPNLGEDFENGLSLFRIRSGESLAQISASGSSIPDFEVFDYAAVLSFEDRELLLSEILGKELNAPISRNPYSNPAASLSDFLENQKHDPQALLLWTQEIFQGEQLDSTNKKEALTHVFERWVREHSDLALGDRVKVLETIGKGGADSYASLAADDVEILLEEGRDWRYEVRQGHATPAQVWSDLQQQLPEVMANEEAREGARSKLFRELAAEDPVAAIDLLEPLSEAETRKILFQSVGGFRLEDAEKFYQYTAALPSVQTESERKSIDQGWRIYSWSSLRYQGEDYIQWVHTMSPGIARDAAVRTIVSGTMEKNPEEGQRLQQEFEREGSKP